MYNISMSDDNNKTGTIGVFTAMQYFSEIGAMPFLPSNDILPYDFIVGYKEEKVKRVSVKATKAKEATISLKIRSRNAEGNVLKKTPNHLYDLLAAVRIHSDGSKEIFVIPSEDINKQSACLTSKWAQSYKVATITSIIY